MIRSRPPSPHADDAPGGRAPRVHRAGIRLAASSLLSLAALLAGAGCSSGDDEPSLRPERNDGIAGKVEPPRVDWGEPTNGDPSLVVMLIHGGGWQPNPAAYAEQRGFAPQLQAAGYATVAIGYDVGAKGYKQVKYVYERARQRYPNLPICAFGTSAGGHLSLMLATEAPGLDCVIDLVGPTDLTKLDDHGSPQGYQFALQAFKTKKALKKYSPARYADRIKADVLMVLAENDPIVPAEQGRELKAVMPSANLIALPVGPSPWLHESTVPADALNAANQAQVDFLAQAATGS